MDEDKEFTPITTQEELDKIIGAETEKYKGFVSPDEVKKAVNAETEKFKGYISPDDFEKKTAEFSERIKTLTAENNAYKTSSLKAKIAAESGLPHELASRITGDDEEAMRADAESLKKLLGSGKAAPQYDPESGKNSKDSALLSVLEKLNN